MNLENYQEAMKLLEDSIHIIHDPEFDQKIDKVLEEGHNEIKKMTTIIDDLQLAASKKKPTKSQGRL